MIGRVHSQVVEGEWIEFPGGELEGTRPKVLCQACRERLKRLADAGITPEAGPSVSGPLSKSRTLCFQCYRTELDRARTFQAAGELDTASEERFQSALPLEPVNRARLERLRADRLHARIAFQQTPAGHFVDRRRRAQIAARDALQRISSTLRARDASGKRLTPESECQRVLASAVHAAELQLPDAWLPFVVSR